MGVKTVVTVAGCLFVAGCGGSKGLTPMVESNSATSSSASPSAGAQPTQLAGVSPPTAAAPNPGVTGTTFDACEVITDADVASWGLDPASKSDISGDVAAGNVRGCKWSTVLSGDIWFLKVYAVNGTVAQWEQPQPQFDRQERVQIGPRQGWAVHDPDQNCSVVLPSQQGMVAVQIDPGTKLADQKFDLCPRAVQIAAAIEPKIP